MNVGRDLILVHGLGWTSTMRLEELKISVDSSGEEELLRNPSSSSVLLQSLDLYDATYVYAVYAETRCLTSIYLRYIYI